MPLLEADRLALPAADVRLIQEAGATASAPGRFRLPLDCWIDGLEHNPFTINPLPHPPAIFVFANRIISRFALAWGWIFNASRAAWIASRH